MKMKKLLALLLALAMVFALCACGDPNAGSSGTPGTDPTPSQSQPDDPSPNVSAEPKDITIGVLSTMVAAGQDLSVKTYIETVLLPHLPNVSVIYSSSFYNIEDEKTELENLITQGADGILVISGLYDIVGLLETCADAGVYMACAVSAPPMSDMEYVLEDETLSQYFIGMCGASAQAEYDAGAAIAKAAMDMAPDGTIAVLGMQGFVEDSYQYLRLEGVRGALGSRYNKDLFWKIEWGDATMTMGSDLLAQAPDAVATTTSGADILCGLIAAKKATETTNVAAIGYISTTYKTFFDNGSLDYSECVYGEQAVGAFALLYNWLNNGLRWSSDLGNFAWCETPYISIPDSATMNTWLEYCGTVENSPYTFEDVQQILVQYNNDVTYEEFETLMQAGTLEDVQARRG